MTTRAENELMTRVEGDAPMGRLMRENYWIPFALSAHLVHGDGADARCGCSARTTSPSGPRTAASASSTSCAPTAAPRSPWPASRATACAASTTAGRSTFGLRRRVPDPDRSGPSSSRPACRSSTSRSTRPAAWPGCGSGGAEAPRLPRPALRRARGPLPLLVRLAGALQLAPGPRGHDRLGARRHAAPDLDRRGGQAWPEHSNLSHRPRPAAAATRPRPRSYGMRAAALRKTADGQTYVRITEHLHAAGDRRARSAGHAARPAPCSSSRRWTTPITCSSSATSATPRTAPSRPTRSPCRTPEYVPDPRDYTGLRGDRWNRWGQDRALMASGSFHRLRAEPARGGRRHPDQHGPHRRPHQGEPVLERRRRGPPPPDAARRARGRRGRRAAAGQRPEPRRPSASRTRSRCCVEEGDALGERRARSVCRPEMTEGGSGPAPSDSRIGTRSTRCS